MCILWGLCAKKFRGKEKESHSAVVWCDDQILNTKSERETVVLCSLLLRICSERRVFIPRRWKHAVMSYALRKPSWRTMLFIIRQLVSESEEESLKWAHITWKLLEGSVNMNHYSGWSNSETIKRFCLRHERSSLHCLNRASWYAYVRRNNKMHTFIVNDVIQLHCLRHVSNNQVFIITNSVQATLRYFIMLKL